MLSRVSLRLRGRQLGPSGCMRGCSADRHAAVNPGDSRGRFGSTQWHPESKYGTPEAADLEPPPRPPGSDRLPGALKERLKSPLSPWLSTQRSKLCINQITPPKADPGGKFPGLGSDQYVPSPSTRPGRPGTPSFMGAMLMGT